MPRNVTYRAYHDCTWLQNQDIEIGTKRLSVIQYMQRARGGDTFHNGGFEVILCIPL